MRGRDPGGLSISDPSTRPPPFPLAGLDQQPQLFCGFLLLPCQEVLSRLEGLGGHHSQQILPTPQLFLPSFWGK